MEENVFNTDLGKKILALTRASFKVSDLIADLVLREKIKAQTLNVYKNFFEKNHSELLKEIDILDSLFYLSGHLNLAKEEHVLSLRNGFLVLKSHIILVFNQSVVGPKSIISEKVKKETKENNDLSARQEKILEKFQSKETLKLAEIMDLFPEVSEKTIRNELSSLIGFKKITRSGQGNGSFYKIIR